MTVLANEVLEDVQISLPGSGCCVWAGRERVGGPTMEVYVGRGHTDLAEVGGLAVPLLRGAVRGRRVDGSPWALAWGQLPAAVTAMRVAFADGGCVEMVDAQIIVGSFWIAECVGNFDFVTVAAGYDRAMGRLLPVGQML